MALLGLISIGNIGINVTYVYITAMLLCSIVIYFTVKKVYKWAIQKQMIRFLSFIGGSLVMICLTVLLAMIQERDTWQFLKVTMQSLAFLGFSLAFFPLLHQFLLKRK